MPWLALIGLMGAGLADMLAPHEEFVVKPSQGSGGDGILVVTGRSKRRRDAFRLSSGVLISRL